MPGASVNLLEGEVDEGMRIMCADALRTLGSVVELLELTAAGTARFRYYGPIKYKIGMEAMAGQCLEDAGYPLQSISFECLRIIDQRDTNFLSFDLAGKGW